jgi:hypothetical protein
LEWLWLATKVGMALVVCFLSRYDPLAILLFFLRTASKPKPADQARLGMRKPARPANPKQLAKWAKSQPSQGPLTKPSQEPAKPGPVDQARLGMRKPARPSKRKQLAKWAKSQPSQSAEHSNPFWRLFLGNIIQRRLFTTSLPLFRRLAAVGPQHYTTSH